MYIQSVSIKLSQPQYDSQDKPLFEVLVDGKPEMEYKSREMHRYGGMKDGTVESLFL